MAQGRKTGGRQKGSVNRRTAEREAAMERAAETIAAVIPGAFDGDAHALLMAVYRDPAQEWALRVQAASKAIGYEKPALSSVEAKVGLSYDDMTEEQLNEIILRDGAAIGLLSTH